MALSLLAACLACLVLQALCAANGEAQTSFECEGMPSEWRQYTNNMCVWVSTEVGSFIDASDWCRELGDINLVRIANENQNTRLTEILQEPKCKGKRTFWVGSYRASFGYYQWVLGQNLTYQNFGKNCKRGNCVTINTDGEWGTEECDKKLPFICRVILKE